MSGRLGRYKDLAWFVAKYGRAEFVTKALHGEESASSDPTAAEAFAKDLESLGPTFIKLVDSGWPGRSSQATCERPACANSDAPPLVPPPEC